MAATRVGHSTKRNMAVSGRVENGALFLALELSWSEWKLAFATGPGGSPRLRSIGARQTQAPFGLSEPWHEESGFLSSLSMLQLGQAS